MKYTNWKNLGQKYADMIPYDELVVDTGKALLIRWGDQKEWIPQSQILSHDLEASTLRLKYWIVEQKGIEDLIEDGGEGYE